MAYVPADYARVVRATSAVPVTSYMLIVTQMSAMVSLYIIHSDVHLRYRQALMR